MFLFSIWGVSDNMKSAIFCVKIKVGEVKKNVWSVNVKFSFLCNSFSFLTASGTYAYIETSFPRNYNDTARLISALIPKNSRPGTCISFWYHMYGPDINTLSVYTKSGGSLGSPIWKRTGSQGNKWKYAQVFVRSLLDYQVGFAQRFCQFCSPSSFFFLRKRDVSYEAKGPSTHTNSEIFRGSYNLEKVLSLSGRLEKSLN